MKCELHSNKEAVGFCSECGKSICEDCKVESEGRVFCTDCVNRDKAEYIVCTKCGGTYTLQAGEKLTDFEACECGGKLQSAGVIKEKPKTTIITDVTKFFGGLTKFTNWVPIIIGVIVVSIITPILVYFSSYTASNLILFGILAIIIVLLMTILSGFIASYVAAKRSKQDINYTTGALYGAVAALLGLIISAFVTSFAINALIFYSLYSINNGFPSTTASDTMGSYDSMSSDIDAPQVDSQNWPIVLIYQTLIFFALFLNPLFLLISLVFGGIGGFLAIKLRNK